eukprot:4432139-Prymnesium_polylepis.1
MELMVGYCMKDQGKPHFNHICKNIPDDFKAHAKAAWNAVRRFSMMQPTKEIFSEAFSNA